MSGVLSEMERDVLNDLAGCGCCSSHSFLDHVVPDDCPKDETYGWVDHRYGVACNQNMSLVEVVEVLVSRREETAEFIRRDGVDQ